LRREQGEEHVDQEDLQEHWQLANERLAWRDASAGSAHDPQAEQALPQRLAVHVLRQHGVEPEREHDQRHHEREQRPQRAPGQCERHRADSDEQEHIDQLRRGALPEGGADHRHGFEVGLGKRRRIAELLNRLLHRLAAFLTFGDQRTKLLRDLRTQ
jgi:hypothetical protein